MTLVVGSSLFYFSLEIASTLIVPMPFSELHVLEFLFAIIMSLERCVVLGLLREINPKGVALLPTTKSVRIMTKKQVALEG